MALPFRFIIVDQFDGCVKGTNNEVLALQFAECDEYYVIDSETGKWLVFNGPTDIQEIKGEG
jgi:hypothetical protein